MACTFMEDLVRFIVEQVGTPDSGNEQDASNECQIQTYVNMLAAGSRSPAAPVTAEAGGRQNNAADRQRTRTRSAQVTANDPQVVEIPQHRLHYDMTGTTGFRVDNTRTSPPGFPDNFGTATVSFPCRTCEYECPTGSFNLITAAEFSTIQVSAGLFSLDRIIQGWIAAAGINWYEPMLGGSPEHEVARRREIGLFVVVGFELWRLQKMIKGFTMNELQNMVKGSSASLPAFYEATRNFLIMAVWPLREFGRSSPSSANESDDEGVRQVMRALEWNANLRRAHTDFIKQLGDVLRAKQRLCEKAAVVLKLLVTYAQATEARARWSGADLGEISVFCPGMVARLMSFCESVGLGLLAGKDLIMVDLEAHAECPQLTSEICCRPDLLGEFALNIEGMQARVRKMNMVYEDDWHGVNARLSLANETASRVSVVDSGRERR
ncbi:hypothetical protein B0T25DRAFT_569371 [Lasiosphaeria hispida]|uniref:Uncharacterized protein n=1 Tax=Lasiosphaeria hispida TaxID=260671 RepID=A0AAJ0HDM8_9PEZI|nr:hypothetical protein B0T25DRAFT_569371 [Lasiosphaeria hispida]